MNAPRDSAFARLFVALPLAGAVRSEALRIWRLLEEAAAPGGVLRRVRPEGLHVTLRFFGNVARERVPEMIRAFEREFAIQPSFVATLGAVHAFPSTTRARVVALELHPEASLEALAAAAERAALAAGFARETRHFRPHVTLARVRERQRIDPAQIEGIAVVAESTAMSADAAVLFESRPGPGGSRYTMLARFPFASVESLDSRAVHEGASAPLLHPHANQ